MKSMKFKGTFFFDPSDRIYSDHFPGNPIVPGSLIVHAFLEALKSEGLNDACTTLENFRFKEFVAPGKYPFCIEQQAGQLNCRLFKSGADKLKPIVTGTIKTCN